MEEIFFELIAAGYFVPVFFRGGGRAPCR